MYNNELTRLVRNAENSYQFLREAKEQNNEIKYHYWMRALLFNISQIEKVMDLVEGMIAPEFAVDRNVYEKAQFFISLVK